jgi:hypothetical protein
MDDAAAVEERFLFHYTGVATAEKIVSSQHLWATHIYYLNDGSEFKHGINLMRSHLAELSKTDRVAQAFLEEVKWSVFSLPKTSVFVVSFSESGDLLSQWRSYCPENRGISLGFEATELLRAAEEQGFKLVRCSYDGGPQYDAVEQLATRSIAAYSASRPMQRKDVIDQFRQEFAGMAASFKNSTFADEQEWRLVKVADGTPADTCYREGKYTLVPYTIFRLGVDHRDRVRIRRVVIGPTLHADLARGAVFGMLTAPARKVLLGQIESSRTTFRAW